MKRSTTLIIGLAVGTVVLVSETLPGIAAPLGARTSATNACNLLRSSEVANAIGEAVKRERGGASATGAKYCNWYGADTHFAEKGVSLIAANDFAKQRYKLYMRQFKTSTPVKGLGDAAASNGEVLFARIGDHKFVYISALYNGSGVTIDELKPLARKALNRLH